MTISLFAPKIQAALAYRESLGSSIKTHTFYLRDFDRFCAKKYPDASCLTREIAWDWVYRPDGSIPYGINYRIRAINFLGEYLTATGEGAFVFPNGMTSEKYRFSPHVFTDDELRHLFAAADSFPHNPRYPIEHRIPPVAFRLIYTCGLRPKEGRCLKRTHVNLNTGEILITDTKFKKERIVVMSDDMLSLCKEYDHYRVAETLNGSEYFFPAQKGGCLDRNIFAKMFKWCWIQGNNGAENLPPVRIYDLRHRFASAVLNRWVDEKRDLYAMLPYLRAYMGHYDLSATEYYVHLLPENLVNSRGVDWVRLESLIPEVDV